VLREVLHELHVEIEVCATAAAAGGVLVKRPVDAVLLDGDLVGALDMIDALARKVGAQQPRIIAILGGKENAHRAFEIGAHFILYKPISRDRTLVSLEYAFRSAGKDRRSGDRRGVYLNTTASSPAADAVPVALFNLSPTGAAVRAKKRLTPDSKLYFEFQIPGQKATVRLSGNVVWQDVQGRAESGLLVCRRPRVRHWISGWKAPIAKKTRNPRKSPWKWTDLAPWTILEIAIRNLRS